MLGLIEVGCGERGKRNVCRAKNRVSDIQYLVVVGLGLLQISNQCTDDIKAGSRQAHSAGNNVSRELDARKSVVAEIILRCVGMKQWS
jgi:hypothetical protein